MVKNNKTEKKKRSRISKFFMILWGLFALGIVACILLFSMISHGKIGYMPPIEELQNPKNKYATEVYTADGKLLTTYYMDTDNRISVEYEDLSPYMVQALLATEDIRFAKHSGIDFKALFRAIVKRGILRQKSAGGGSTLTQQLAKQLYTPTAESTFERLLQKPIEWVIAVKLERFYTKEAI